MEESNPHNVEAGTYYPCTYTYKIMLVLVVYKPAVLHWFAHTIIL